MPSCSVPNNCCNTFLGIRFSKLSKKVKITSGRHLINNSLTNFENNTGFIVSNLEVSLQSNSKATSRLHIAIINKVISMSLVTNNPIENDTAVNTPRSKYDFPI